MGYDAHLFIKELAASSTDRAKMGVIAKDKDDYISFSIKVEVDKSKQWHPAALTK